MVSSGISDVIASVHSEKTRLKKLMMMMIMMIIIKKMKRYVGLLMALKKNENKGDVELTLSQKQTNNSLKTDKYMTAIPT